MRINVFWFRRDLRLEDNTGLNKALAADLPVLPIFIFDTQILSELPKNDSRVTFIYDALSRINQQLKAEKSCLLIEHGCPVEVWKKILESHEVIGVYSNKDYEPYAINRDKSIKDVLHSKGIEFNQYKDHVIHEENEVLKSDGLPYTVYTPYKNKWLDVYRPAKPIEKLNPSNLYKHEHRFPELSDIGFSRSSIKVQAFDLEGVSEYGETRNFPALDSTSRLGPHLRFGTIGIRQLIDKVKDINSVFVSELIWREFFIQILFHFPKVVTNNFRSKYDGIKWRNNKAEFNAWCAGKTGYPMVDAGMRQLNETGYMHNRVRMVTASFLCKHLLIDWRLGEAYFAEKLLDFELASNNGNWQWSAGTGCDAAPYFRVFNPMEQLKKFDANETYVKQWIPEYGSSDYTEPIVEHKMARQRALEAYKAGILVE